MNDFSQLIIIRPEERAMKKQQIMMRQLLITLSLSAEFQASLYKDSHLAADDFTRCIQLPLVPYPGQCMLSIGIRPDQASFAQIDPVGIVKVLTKNGELSV
jgi:hypothetical protein